MEAEDIIARMGRLEEKRSQIDGIYEQVRKICFPMSKSVFAGADPAGDATIDRYEVTRLLDATALKACQTLANGQLSHVTPVGETWFSYDPPHELLEDEDAKAWFADCTQIVQRAIAGSNFYSVVHETYLNRAAFGIGCLYCEWSDRKQSLIFREEPVGTYCVEEDSEQLVDTVYRRFYLTARQAMQHFEDVPDAIRRDAENPRKQDEKLEFIHAVFPRTSVKNGQKGALAMPWASVYVAVRDKSIVKESGFLDCPYAVARWIKWGDTPYGVGPGFFALPTAKQANFLEAMTDFSCEKSTFPSLLVPASYKYEIDSRPGGVTQFDPTGVDNVPREWQGNSGYQFNKDRVMDKRAIIEDIFYVPLFQVISEVTKQMTAREVNERVGEKLSMFHPIFARMTTELLTPMLRRIFFLLMENGRLPQPPASTVQIDATGKPIGLAVPEVQYTSKIALAIKAQQLNAFNSMLQVLSGVAQVDPSVMDVVNFEMACRDISRTLGLPNQWLKSVEEVAELREQRAAAQEQAAQMQQVQSIAGAVKDAGGIDEVSKLMK